MLKETKDFDQDAVHILYLSDKINNDEIVGVEDDNGRAVIPVVNFEFKHPITAAEFGKIVKDNGIEGASLDSDGYGAVIYDSTMYATKEEAEKGHKEFLNKTNNIENDSKRITGAVRANMSEQRFAAFKRSGQEKGGRTYAWGHGNIQKSDEYRARENDERTAAGWAVRHLPKKVRDAVQKVASLTPKIGTYLNLNKSSDDYKRLQSIGRMFDRMPLVDLSPKVKAAYNTLNEIIKAQYDRLPIKVYPNNRPIISHENIEQIQGIVNELNTAIEAKDIKKITELQKQLDNVVGWSENRYDDAYSNSKQMMADVNRNNQMEFFTTGSGFGDGSVDYTGHPLLEPTYYYTTPVPAQDKNGKIIYDKDGNEVLIPKQLLNNDVLRVVHDYVAHAASGASFGAKGEERAWAAHVASIINEEGFSDRQKLIAIQALTSETRGQNTWVNFVNEFNRDIRNPLLEIKRNAEKNNDLDTAAKADEMLSELPYTEFADQKVGLLPTETMIGGYESTADSDKWIKDKLEKEKLYESEQSDGNMKEQSLPEDISDVGEFIEGVREKDNESFAPITKEEIKTLIDWLNKAFGGAVRVLGLDAFNARAKELGVKPIDIKYPDGTIYGAVLPDGSMYLNPEKLNANTPIHEHTHLFNQVIQQTNPKLWNRMVEAVKGIGLWNEVKNDPNYANLKTDSQIADEVYSRLAGNKGEVNWQERIAKADSKSALGKIGELIKEYWNAIKELFGVDIYKGMTADDFANMTLDKLFSGKDITKENPLKSAVRSVLESLFGKKALVVDSVLFSFIKDNEKGDTYNRNRFKKYVGEKNADYIKNRFSNIFSDSDNFIEFSKKHFPIKGDIVEALKRSPGVVERLYKNHLGVELGKNVEVNNVLTTKELLGKNGYKLSDVIPNLDIAKTLFYDYYLGEGSDERVSGSVICTMGDPRRFRENYVMWVVKENAENQPRATHLTEKNMTPEWAEYLEKNGRKNEDGTFNLNGLKDEREDPFSTSVLSIQIPKGSGKVNPKIISRYNHDLQKVGDNKNPDNVFGGDLNELAPNLKEAFEEQLGVELVNKSVSNEIQGFTQDNKGRYYKYTKEVNGVYYGEGFYIKNGETTLLDAGSQRMVGGFVINANGKVENVARERTVFYYGIIQKVNSINGNEISVTTENGDFVFETNNGDVSKLKSWSNDEYVLAELGGEISKNGDITINIDFDTLNHRFWNDRIVEIKGDAFFDDSQITSLGNLRSIGGSAYFGGSQITSLGNLQSIGGKANFGGSQITSLGNLQSIGGYATFYDSQITSLGNLPSIGGGAFFYESQSEMFKDLKTNDKQATDIVNIFKKAGDDFHESLINNEGKIFNDFLPDEYKLNEEFLNRDLLNESNDIRFSISNSNTNFNDNEKTKRYKDSQGKEIPYNVYTPNGNSTPANLLQREGNSNSESDFALVERRFIRYKQLNFTAGTKIKSLDDVAWLFRNLEDEAVEHSFVTYIMPDDSYVVQHLGTGGITSAVVDNRLVVGNAIKMGAKSITFVHNHPSGSLAASKQDMNVYSNLKKAVEGTGIDVQDGVIINLKSGKFVTFDSNSDIVRNITEQNQEQHKVKVLSFSKQVFAENYNPEKIRSSADVAKLITTKKFGVSDKTEMLVLNNRMEVVGKFVLPESNQYSKIVELLTQYGGVSAILYGNNINPTTINEYNKKLRGIGFEILDGVEVKSDNYKSLSEAGLINEDVLDYNKNNTENENNLSEILDKRGIDDVSLQKLNEYGKQIEQGTAVYQRFPQEVQRGFISGGSRHVEASLITGREVGTRETQDDRADRQEEEVETYAKQVGIWHDNTEEYLAEIYGEPISSGRESLVYNNGETVVKTSNIGQYRDLEDALDSITLHNFYFPGSAIKVLGFGLDADENFQIITEQPFIVEGGRKATQEEIDSFVEELGFGLNASYGIAGRFMNDQYLLKDLVPRNVILTPEGLIVPIDTIMHINRDVWGFGGKVTPTNIISPAPDVVENKRDGINVLITPATVRSFDAETKRLQTLTNEYSKVASEITKGDLTNKNRFTELQDAILNSYQEDIEKKVAEIRGVDVEFNAPYIGSWQGSYEPSLNMTVRIEEGADTGALSGLLFEIAENTSQDAFILEEESEISDRIPLTEVDDKGYTHYPQVRVNFERDLTVAEKSVVAQRLNKSGIENFSIDGNYFIVSIIDFNEYETDDTREMGYAKAYESITTPFRGEGGKIGANKVRSVQNLVRKSRYVGARNEGDGQAATREYDKRNLFETQGGVKPTVNDGGSSTINNIDTIDSATRPPSLKEAATNLKVGCGNNLL